MKNPFHRIDLSLAAAAALGAFFVYLRTLVPGVIPNDSAEFQTLAYALDHAHTTGYPVYLVLAHLFQRLPFGEPAFEVNLFSALMAAFTVGLTFLSGKLLSGSRWGGLIGAAALAVMPTFWSQAIIAEVYTAGSAFTAGVLLALLIFWETRRPTAIFAAGVLLMAGIGVHGTVVLMMPAALVLLALTWKKLKKRFSAEEKAALRRNTLRSWLPGLYGSFAGLVLFLLCFAVVDLQDHDVGMVALAYQPSISRFGGQPEDIDTITERFAFLVFARQWRPAMFVDPGATLPENFSIYMRAYWQDTTLLARLLVWAGLVLLAARRWRLGLFFLTLILVHWLYSFHYRIGDIYVFFISLYVYYAVLIAEGAGKLLQLLARIVPKLALVLTPLAALALLALAVYPVFQPSIRFLQRGEARWEFMGLPSNADLAKTHQYAVRNMAAVPENAIVLAGWMDLYTHVYAARVDLQREDVRFFEAYPYAQSNRMADTLVRYLREQNEAGRAVVTLEEYPELAERGLPYRQQRMGVRIMYLVEKTQ